MDFSRLLFAVCAVPVVLCAAQDPILHLSFDTNEVRTSQSTGRPALALATNVFSVAYWVMPLDLPSHNCSSRWEKVSYRLVASNGSGYYDGFRTGLVWHGGRYHPFFAVGGPERRGGGDAAVSVPTNAWAHIAWTWDGAEIVGYVNGERACAHGCRLPLTPPRDKLAIGATGYGMPPLPMRIASFTCWDRVLAQDDIDALTKGRFPAREATRFTEKGRWAEARALYAKLGDWQPPASVPAYAQVPPRRPAAPPPRTAATVEARSWSEALARVRELKKSGATGGVTVLFRGGEHPMTETVRMDAADSGSADFPIVYAAYPGEEPVFTGGVTLPPFEKVSDPETLKRLPTEAARANVRVCDLSSFGALSPMPTMGWGFGEKAVPDVYVDGRWMQPARYPNDGFLHATNIVDKTNCIFRVDAAVGDMSAWAREPDLMGCGYWVWCWADFTVPLKTDLAAGTFTITPKLRWPMAASWNPDLNYFLVNALHALDREGEYYLDARARRLYAWLPPSARTCTLSMFPNTSLELNNVHHVQFRGLTFRYGRGRAVVASGCSDLVFAGNRFLDFGGQGFTFSGRDTLIWGNTFRGFGCAALDVAGGNRRTLEASGIRLENNDISQTSRAVRTYTPGLRLHGCGSQVVYNHFHEILSSAMRLEGNDFLVSMNLVENVVKESGDQGGVDIYNNPSYQGNVYSYNIWRNIGCRGHGQAGIRFDDRISGQVVYGNRFDDASDAKFFGGVQMNGGRRNLIDNNVFTRCAIGVSAGGWEGPRWVNSFTNAQGRAQVEREVDIYAPPYTTRYPGIETLVHETVMTNTFTRNVFVGDGVFLKAHGGRNALFRNWRFEKLPDLDELARETCFDPLPPESDIGTY